MNARIMRFLLGVAIMAAFAPAVLVAHASPGVGPRPETSILAPDAAGESIPWTADPCGLSENDHASSASATAAAFRALRLDMRRRMG